MFDIQSHFIFPAHAVAKAGPMPADAEAMSLRTADGATLAGIHLAGDASAKNRMLILGFGGNAWNAQDVAEYLRQIFPQADIVAFHYRGYWPSTGSPSAEALIADAPLVYDAAVKKVKPAKVIAIGFSIGTGVAAQLSASRPLDGLCLVTPFDSLKAVAQSMMPWLPIGSLFSHEIDAAEPLSKSDVPVAILAAAHDEIVPAARTEALRKAVRNLVFDRTISKAGHNDIYARSDFQDAMRQTIAAFGKA